MLYQYFNHIASDPLLTWCCAAMVLLAIYDFGGILATLFGVTRFRHIDFSTSIVSIGLLATFFGVLLGLYGFDPKDISASVPQLLEGLRFAFGASALGMFLSVALSILHKLIEGGDGNDEVILSQIDKNLSILVATLKSPVELTRQFTEFKSFLVMHLEKINDSLGKALDQLARGASQEVTQALEKIIHEFNDNLTSQFGDNFKELNAACHKLVTWQSQYQQHVEIAESSLSTIIVSLKEACSAVDELSRGNAETKKVCEEVGGLIKTYDVQVRTLSTHLESCKRLGEEAGAFLDLTGKAITESSENLAAFSGVIEQSVSKQSESLAQLTQDLNNQLPKTLGELEKVLVGITNQFAADYRSLFQFITDKR